ncbi:MAG: HAMP domain-containing histidine kinase [Clostridia bacterium]|nr:HAMP domain-containing histidine kinase [Clostridia bacterium]
MLKQGITRRWVFNGFGVTLAMLVLLEILAIVVLHTTTYNSVEEALYSRAGAISDSLADLAQESGFDMETTSRSLVENFVDKEMMELQMVRADGEILYSSSGFLPESTRLTNSKDYRDALSGEEGTGVTRYRTSARESVMAMCVAVKNGNGLVGIVRCVVSLTQVRRQLWGMVALAIGAGLLVMVFVALSGSYFIGSIINPIKEVGRAARRIAMGDYRFRIKRRYDDEIGELCDTINYMAGEIDATERMKNDFISSVSHELRTPLTAIKGWSETMADGVDDPELMKAGLAIIRSETERLTGMVEELLDFSRMQDGKMTLKPERVDVGAELEEVILLLREKATAEGITLNYVETDGLPFVMADPARLKQVFINIVDNAIKYSGRGGRVRVEAAQMGSRLQIVISDNGVGIKPEDLPKVKTRFFRADHARPGSGVGLAVADEIMHRHGGSLDIHSEYGKGTTVTLTLPLRFVDKNAAV